MIRTIDRKKKLYLLRRDLLFLEWSGDAFVGKGAESVMHFNSDY